MCRSTLYQIMYKGGNAVVFQNYKYLGFTLDETLSYGSQVNNVIKLVAFKTNLLAKIRTFLTEDTALRIYKSMFGILCTTNVEYSTQKQFI